MPRRKKGRDKAHGKKRRRGKEKGFTLNVRPYLGPPREHVPREHTPWEQRRALQPTERSLEDIIGLAVLHGKENPLREVNENGNESRLKAKRSGNAV
jgi:hypothetical protein